MPRLWVRPRLEFDIELGYNTSVDVDAGIGLAGRGGTYLGDERAWIATCRGMPRYTQRHRRVILVACTPMG